MNVVSALQDILTQCAALLTPDLAQFVLERQPDLFAALQEIVNAVDPKPQALPDEIIQQLAEVDNKADRFRQAVAMLGIRKPELLPQLVDRLKASGLWKTSEFVKSVSKDYAKRANSSIGLIFPLSIGKEEFLHDDIPLHLTLKTFEPHKIQLEEIHSRLKNAPLHPPNPRELSLTPHVITSERSGEKFHVLSLNNIPAHLNDAYEKLRDIGITYPTFKPHITVPEKLWHHINDKKLSASDLQVDIKPLELRYGNQVLHRFDEHLRKAIALTLYMSRLAQASRIPAL